MQTNKQKMYSNTIGILIISLLVGWLGSGYFLNNSNKDVEQKTKKASTVKVPNVGIILSKAENREKILNLSGETAPSEEVIIANNIAGVVSKINMKRGTYVDKNTTLAEIYVKDLQAEFDLNENIFNRAKKDLDDAKVLFEKAVYSANRLAQAKEKYLNTVRLLDKTREKKEDTLLITPISGIIENIFIEENEKINKSQKLFSVKKINPLKCISYVNQIEVMNIKKGQMVYGETLSGQAIEGKITYVSKIGDSDTKTFQVETEINNEKKKFQAVFQLI